MYHLGSLVEGWSSRCFLTVLVRPPPTGRRLHRGSENKPAAPSRAVALAVSSGLGTAVAWQAWYISCCASGACRFAQARLQGGEAIPRLRGLPGELAATIGSSVCVCVECNAATHCHSCNGPGVGVGPWEGHRNPRDSCDCARLRVRGIHRFFWRKDKPSKHRFPAMPQDPPNARGP